jgi:hypothetical protein
MIELPAPNRTLGWGVLDWSTQWLLQPDGPDAGNPWKYTTEQAQMVLVWYEVDEVGRFLRRRGVIRRMKGWGKDPFLAALSYAEACGPVRFGGWDANGFPIGIQHTAPWIQIAAVSKDQTKNTMTLFPGLTSPELKKTFGVDLGKEIIYVRGGIGRIESVTSSPRSLEGGRPSLVVLNETHHWLANNEGLEMADVIRRNLGKSRDGSARSIEITNAHLPGEGSVAELTYNAIKQGEIAGVWYDAREAPECPDLTDEVRVKDALTFARGDSYWVDIDRLYDEIMDPATPEYKSRRFYLNQVVLVDIDRWLPQGVWSTLADYEYHIPEHDRVVLGFDGSYNGDATGLVAVTIDRPIPFVHLLSLEERPYGAVEYRVPRQKIMQDIRTACAYYNVVEVAVDPALWQSDLEQLMDEGYPIVEFQQRGQRMIEATQRLYEDVTRSRFSHDGSPDLARHMANAWVKDPLNPRIQKENQSSRNWVDMAVATVMASQRAKEIAMESQFATVIFGSDYTPVEPAPAPPRGPQFPKILTQADMLVPNQMENLAKKGHPHDHI